MAVYNQVLTYTFRDSLSLGDPNKIIKGAYLDGEFSAIHVASLDAVSLSQNNTLTGTTQTVNGQIVVGSASGGGQGAGTINATGVYVNGVAVNTSTSIVGKYKTTSTSRASNATPSNDPDLVYAIPSTGFYEVTAFLLGTTGPGGFSLGLSFSGTVAINPNILVTTSNPGDSAPYSSTINNFGTVGFTNTVTFVYAYVITTGFHVTATGTVGVSWSQASPNSSPAVLEPNSYLKVTKLA